MNYFVKNALSFLAGLAGSTLILQGDAWAGLAIIWLAFAFILCDYFTPKN